jgi:hypothetical protein
MPELDSPLSISCANLQKVPEVTFHKSFLKRIVELSTSDEVWQKEYEHSISGNPSPGITYLHRALYCENRLWVPKDESRRQEILESEHDSKVVEHIRQDKTVKLI